MLFQATRTSVSFGHGSTPVAGDLVVPAGPSPHPAVALVGGVSGPRDTSRWVDELAHSGLMTLSWDSPGWGDTPGSGAWQSPDQRMPELLAAVDYLTGPEVPASGVGLIAEDLGSWAGIMAAGLSPQVEALVLLSPPLSDLLMQEAERLGRQLRARGFSSAEVQLAQAVLLERCRRLATGQSGHAVLAAEAACRHAPWYPWLPGTTAEEFEAYAAIARYDAWTLLSMVRCPVLAVFVEHEQPATVWRDAELARQALDTRSGHDHRVLVMPAAGSGQVITWDLARTGPTILQEGSFDLIALIADWLRPRVSRDRWRHAC